jgi:hypothetical protein
VRAFDLQADLGGSRGNQLDHGHAIDERRPRQVCVMWQDKRCSILFHFEVPGGRDGRLRLEKRFQREIQVVPGDGSTFECQENFQWRRDEDLVSRNSDRFNREDSACLSHRNRSG